MKIFYHAEFNIDFGFFNRLHPFDGTKYRRVYEQIKILPDIDIIAPAQAISMTAINKTVNELIQMLLLSKNYILAALELPIIPFIPFSFIDRKILLPMRWGVAATLEAARLALTGENCWNLAGGYHHASHANCQGFCIYNDIKIAINELREEQKITSTTRVLIIDVDAHHGNGNASSFEQDKAVTILDQYNADIYPQTSYSKRRIDINLPIASGTDGACYLKRLRAGLQQLREKMAGEGSFALAFVVAGTDVLIGDPLGSLGLTVQECIERDVLIMDALKELQVPAVFLGGGGYSKDSALAIAGSIQRLYRY